MTNKNVEIVKPDNNGIAKNFLISLLGDEIKFNNWKDRGIPLDFYITDSIDGRILILAKNTNYEISDNFYNIKEIPGDKLSHRKKIDAFFNDYLPIQCLINRWLNLVNDKTNEESLNFIKKYYKTEKVWRLETKDFSYIENLKNDLIRKESMNFEEFLKMIKLDNENKLNNDFINNNFIVDIIANEMVHHTKDLILEEFKSKLYSRMLVLDIPKNFEDLKCLVVNNDINEDKQFGSARFLLTTDKDELVALVYVRKSKNEEIINIDIFDEEKLKRMTEVFKYLLKAEDLLNDINEKNKENPTISYIKPKIFEDNPLKYLKQVENVKYIKS